MVVRDYEMGCLTRRALLGAAAIAPLTLAHGARAEAYPAKPLSLIVPSAAGGTLDTLARTIVESMSGHFSRPIAVLNKPGGGGSIGFVGVVGSPPDGYTIGISGLNALTISPFTTPGLPYRDATDVTLLRGAASSALVLAVASSSPYKTVKELLDAARAAPGTIRLMMAGVGSTPHTVMKALEATHGISFALVPSPGGAEPLMGLLGGHVDGVLETPLTVSPHAAAGKVRLLAILSAKRSALLPDVPTIVEAGIDFTANVNYFLFGPKGLPGPVVETLNTALGRAMQEAAFQNFLADRKMESFDLVGDELNSPIVSDRSMFEKVLLP